MGFFNPVGSGGGSVTASATGSIGWTGLSQMQSPSDGIITLLNNAGTGFTRLQIGGTTSGFPSLGRNAANLQVLLADGSNWAMVQGGSYQVRPDTGLTAGGSLSMAIQLSSAGIGLYAGSGAPTISAAQGSVYMRSDGSSTSTRLYVATSSAGAWTNVTTAA